MALKNNPKEHEDVTFASVLADGKIHVSVAEGTDGAVERAYATEEDKKSGSDKKSGLKHELIYTELEGMLLKVDFHEGNYGKNLLLTIGEEDDEKPTTLSLATEGNFGEDAMKKLPNIDLKKAVILAPYSFPDKRTGKQKRGVTITQKNKKGEDVKIASFYTDSDKKAPINGYPVNPKAKKGEKIAKSVWRKFFGEAREFLIEDITKRFKIEEQKSQADKDYDDMG